MSAADAPAAERPAGFRELLGEGRLPLVLGVLGATLIASLDYLLALTVLPEAARDVGGVERYAVAVGLYSAAMIAGIPAGGALIDRYGPRRVLVLGALVFAGAAIVAGAAPSIEWIAAARCVQGLGTGLLLAVPVAAIALYLPARVQRTAYAANSLVWSISSVVGPAAGSLLTSLASWRWAFWAVVPPIVLVLVLAVPALRGARPATRPNDVDLVGPVLLGLVVAALLLLPLAAIPAALALVLQQRRARRGLLPPSRPARLVLIAAAAAGAGFFACEGLISLVVQAGLGWPAVVAGGFFVLSATMWSIGTIATSRMAIEPARQIRIGLGVVATGAATMALPLGAPGLIVGFGVGGLGMGIASPALFLAIVALADEGAGGRAASSVPLARTIGGGVGVAAGGALLAAVVGRAALDAAETSARVPEIVDGGRAAFAFGAVAALAGLLAIRRLADRPGGP